MLNKLWKESTAVILGLSMLVACNGNNPFDRESDPAKAYPSLKGDVTEEQLQPDQREQNALVKPFDISVLPVDTNRLQFIAGEENRYEISARVFIDGVNYTLKVKNGPEGVELKEKDSEQGIWEVIWTPPKNAVAIKDKESEIPFEIELITTSSSEDANKQIAALEKIKQYTLEVRKSKKDPFIVGSSELDNVKIIKEDKDISFSLIVEDPAAYDDLSPEIIVGTKQPNSTESGILHGGNAIVAHPTKKIEKLSDGRWKTHWVFLTSFLAASLKDKKVNDKITVEFRMQAISQATGNDSVNWTKQVTIEFNKEVIEEGAP